MVKEELIQFEGLVIEIFFDVCYCVQFDVGYEIVVYIVGKMKKNCIKILVGDCVMVEMFFYDFEKGWLIFCYKDECLSIVGGFLCLGQCGGQFCCCQLLIVM